MVSWTGNYSSKCNVHNELVVIDSLLEHNTEGDVYTVSDTSFNLAPDASMNFGFYGHGNGADYKYWIKFHIQVDNSVNIRTIEDASWNPIATAAYTITPKCMNRDTPGTCYARVYKNPPLKYGSGTLIKQRYVMAYTSLAGTVVKQMTLYTSDEAFELVLPSNKYYAVNIVNESTGNANIVAECYIIQLNKNWQ